MSAAGQAYIVGAFEHPTRKATDTGIAQLHAEIAQGAAADAGLTLDDIDGLFISGDPGQWAGLAMAEYMGLKLRHLDTTETGGSSYLIHVGHAVDAIAQGRCDIALVSLAGRPRTLGVVRVPDPNQPDRLFESIYGTVITDQYAMVAMRHMHEFGTTSEQMAWVKVAASHHAQYNPNAMLQEVVTVEDVVNSPMVADPLHRLDCCVISDGGGAVIVARPEIAAKLNRPKVRVRGSAEAVKYSWGAGPDLTTSAAARSGPAAFANAGVTPADIKYASIYDSFTITVIMQLEDLGFCEKGQGGRFVQDGALISGTGRLPFNTDGGGLCNNHPSNRGGMTKIIEAVRQLRGEAHPKVQVPNCDLAVATGIGGSLAYRHASGTLILERE